MKPLVTSAPIFICTSVEKVFASRFQGKLITNLKRLVKVIIEGEKLKFSFLSADTETTQEQRQRKRRKETEGTIKKVWLRDTYL